jgi:hypothetical protein
MNNNEVLEYRSIGVLGFKCITPSLQYSKTLASVIVDKAVQPNEADEVFAMA